MTKNNKVLYLSENNLNIILFIMVEELKTNPELDQLWDTIVNGGFDKYYEELKINTDEKWFELLEYLVNTWDKNVVWKEVTDEERVSFGSNGVITTFYTILEELLNRKNGIAYLYSKLNWFNFNGEVNLLKDVDKVFIQLLYIPKLYNTEEKRYTINKENIWELKKVYELLKNIWWDPYIASEQYLKLLQVEDLLGNSHWKSSPAIWPELERIKWIVATTLTWLSSWEINPAQRIEDNTWDIQLIAEQIWSLDNQLWERSELLRNTQKALEKLKIEIESLEMKLTNKISEWTDFSSCCG